MKLPQGWPGKSVSVRTLVDSAQDKDTTSYIQERHILREMLLEHDLIQLEAEPDSTLRPINIIGTILRTAITIA